MGKEIDQKLARAAQKALNGEVAYQTCLHHVRRKLAEPNQRQDEPWAVFKQRIVNEVVEEFEP